MALAVLCSHLQSHSSHHSIVSEREALPLGFPLRPKFQAFVVDHGMRLGSAEEASNVSGILEQRGIPTKILKIEWPQSENPNSAPNFESLARKYRFRLLGKACKDAGINSLLLAHHEDDQAETILMRLVSGHRMAGLTGIKPKTSIPECYGLHGIHESGGRDSLPKVGIASNQEIRLSPNPIQSHHIYGNQPAPETGGITIYRPLLTFSKVRLISTCQAEGMPWFEDHTNKNPTITRRNAIRHIFNKYSLPRALTKPRLLSMAKEIAEKAEIQSQLLKTWLAKCEITSFDTGTGTLAACFPDFNEDEYMLAPPIGIIRQLAAELLSRIITLVSPEERIELSSLHGAVAHIFPEITGTGGPKKTQKAFTVCGVFFQPIQSISSTPNLPSQYKQQSKTQWFLSRQPYNSDATKKPLLQFEPTGGNYSSWQLYDGRYWIRIQDPKFRDAYVRPFHENDKKELENSALSGTWDKGHLRKILKQRAPGNVRWTLPVIIGSGRDGCQRVLGLPTLGIGGSLNDTLRWEVRYKKVYTADLAIVEEKLNS